MVSVLILAQFAALGDEPTAPLADRVKSVVDAIDDGVDGQFREVASIRASSPGTGPAISRDDSRVAYIDNNRLHLRSLEVEGLEAEMPVDAKTAFFLHIDPDPEHSIVAIADRHKFCVFDCESSKELLTRQLDASEDRYLEWTVSANGRFVAGLTSRMIVFVVDLHAKSVELHGFRGDEPLKNGSIAVSNDGNGITLLLQPNTILFVPDDQQTPNDVSRVRYVANPGAILSGGDDAFGLLADNDCTLVTLNGFDEINYIDRVGLF